MSTAQPYPEVTEFNQEGKEFYQSLVDAARISEIYVKIAEEI